jgi:hypothetical protein
MQGVTTAIVAFIFLALAMPSLIKEKNQYYVAFIAVIGIIFVDALAHMFPATAAPMQAVCYVLSALGQIIAIVMLFLATGGLTFRELTGDMIEVLRRGGEEKEVIIPLSDEAKRKISENQERAARKVRADEETARVFTIDDPTAAPAATAANPPPAAARPPAAPPSSASSTGPLPLE